MDEIKATILRRMSEQSLTALGLCKLADANYHSLKRWMAGDGVPNGRTIEKLANAVGLRVTVIEDSHV